jgi:TPR repeat protein
MYNLGVLYYNGDGVPQDDGQAAAWIRRAAELGVEEAKEALEALGAPLEAGAAPAGGEAATDPEAQFKLGAAYDFGSGVEADKGKALAWYAKAAGQGHPRAMYNLGVLYYNGDGVAQDDGQAAAWIRRAAELGVEEARAALEVLGAGQEAPGAN